MNERKFFELYQRQKESGLTVKEFCANEIIAPSTFYRWQNILKSQNRLPGFIPLVVDTSPDLTRDKFNEGHLLPDVSSPNGGNTVPIEIEFSNKTIIRIKDGLDLSLLKALIRLNE